MAATLDFGALGFVYKGFWEAGVTYPAKAVVTHDDALWYTATGVLASEEPPGENPLWLLMLRLDGGTVRSVNGVQPDPVSRDVATIRAVSWEEYTALREAGEVVPGVLYIVEDAQAVQAAVVAPEPGTAVLRGPTGTVKGGEPVELNDLVTLGRLVAWTHAPAGVDALEYIRSNLHLAGKVIQFSGGVFTGTPDNAKNWKMRFVRSADLNPYLDVEALHTGSAERWINRYGPSDDIWAGWKRIDSGGAFPSGSRTNMTLPANGGTIAAPHDGYVKFAATATAAAFISLLSFGAGGTDSAGGAGGRMVVTIPVRSGETLTIGYAGINTTQDLILACCKPVSAA